MTGQSKFWCSVYSSNAKGRLIFYTFKKGIIGYRQLVIPKWSLCNRLVSVVRCIAGLTKLLSECRCVVESIPDFLAEIIGFMSGRVWIGDRNSNIEQNQNQSGKMEFPLLKYFSRLILFFIHCWIAFWVSEPVIFKNWLKYRVVFILTRNNNASDGPSI